MSITVTKFIIYSNPVTHYVKKTYYEQKHCEFNDSITTTHSVSNGGYPLYTESAFMSTRNTAGKLYPTVNKFMLYPALML